MPLRPSGGPSLTGLLESGDGRTPSPGDGGPNPPPGANRGPSAQATQVAEPVSSPRRPEPMTCSRCELTWRPMPPIVSRSEPVFRAVAAAAADPDLQRNVVLDLVAALGIGSSMAVVGALLPAVARREGLDPLGLAALAALPFLASLLSLLAGRIGPRTPDSLAARSAPPARPVCCS